MNTRGDDLAAAAAAKYMYTFQKQCSFPEGVKKKSTK